MPEKQRRRGVVHNWHFRNGFSCKCRICCIREMPCESWQDIWTCVYPCFWIAWNSGVLFLHGLECSPTESITLHVGLFLGFWCWREPLKEGFSYNTFILSTVFAYSWLETWDLLYINSWLKTWDLLYYWQWPEACITDDGWQWQNLSENYPEIMNCIQQLSRTYPRIKQTKAHQTDQTLPRFTAFPFSLWGVAYFAFEQLWAPSVAVGT